MTLATLYPFKFSYADVPPNRQGRSKKQLRPVIKHEGRAWVAYYEGRGNRFFGASKQDAQNNMEAGAA